MTETPVTVLLVNWNCGEFLVRCVETVLRNEPSHPCHVFVVDNASTDRSLELLLAYVAQSPAARASVEVLCHPENLGFARAVNQGLRATCSPFVFVLNPDTEVRPGAIDALAGLWLGTPEPEPARRGYLVPTDLCR